MVATVLAANATKALADWLLSTTCPSRCENEVMGIIGPNGSGKTTMMNSISSIAAE